MHKSNQQQNKREQRARYEINEMANSLAKQLFLGNVWRNLNIWATVSSFIFKFFFVDGLEISRYTFDVSENKYKDERNQIFSAIKGISISV